MPTTPNGALRSDWKYQCENTDLNRKAPTQVGWDPGRQGETWARAWRCKKGKRELGKLYKV